MSKVLGKLPHRKSLTRFVIANDPSCLIQHNMEDTWTSRRLPAAATLSISAHLSHLRREAPTATPPFLRSSVLLTCTGSHTCYDFLHLKRKNTLTPTSLQLLSHFLFHVFKFPPPTSLELALIRLPTPPLHDKGDCQGH